jgi:hypothetical protein
MRISTMSPPRSSDSLPSSSASAGAAPARDHDRAGTVVAERAHHSDEVGGLVRLRPTVGEQLLVADLEQVRVALQHRGQPVAGEVRRHPAAVHAEIFGEPAVERGRHRPVLLRAGQQHPPVQQALGERHLVQRVLVVTVQRVTGGLGDRLPRTLAAVVHVRAVAALDPHGPHLDRPGRQQVPDHVAGLAAEGGAQHHRDAKRGDHPGLPDACPPAWTCTSGSPARSSIVTVMMGGARR